MAQSTHEPKPQPMTKKAFGAILRKSAGGDVEIVGSMTLATILNTSVKLGKASAMLTEALGRPVVVDQNLRAMTVDAAFAALITIAAVENEASAADELSENTAFPRGLRSAFSEVDRQLDADFGDEPGVVPLVPRDQLVDALTLSNVIDVIVAVTGCAVHEQTDMSTLGIDAGRFTLLQFQLEEAAKKKMSYPIQAVGMPQLNQLAGLTVREFAALTHYRRLPNTSVADTSVVFSTSTGTRTARSRETGLLWIRDLGDDMC